MKTAFIYALKCPNSGAVRYIGKSNNPKGRLSNHLRAFERERNHRACWIRSLHTTNQKPLVEILDEVPFEHWQQWEVAYIEFFRETGCDLVNSTAGGEGAHGLSDESRARFSVARIGKRASIETRKKQSASRMGIKFTPEHCENLSLSRRGKKNPGFGKKGPNNKSGFAGVCWDQTRNKWIAYINCRHLGRFSKLEDAIFVRALMEACHL